MQMNKFLITHADGVQFVLDTDKSFIEVSGQFNLSTDIQPVGESYGKVQVIDIDVDVPVVIKAKKAKKAE